MLKTTLLRQIYALVFPIHCLGCGQESDWLCQDCQKRLHLSRGEQCVLCGKAGHHGLCTKCRKQTKLDGVVSLFPYREKAIQELVKAVKYRGHTDAFYFFSQTYRLAVWRRLPESAFTASYVPLSRQRQAERGFNQARLLAQGLAGDEAMLRPLLIKTRETESQTTLDKKKRRQNLRRAFRVTKSPIPERVLLFDDVITTGTTLSEAAKALRKAGAQEIWAVTIAHG